tara:strand:- start:173 stop:997 length:825 start_codon:yes stop_codon:yes gene_type:complete
MFKLFTSQKIFFASILSKILIFFLGKKKRIINRNGINYEIDLNEGIDLGIFLNIKNERKMFNISNILDVKSDLNFIDIGSNVGSIALPLCKLFKSSKIYAIEPTFYAYNKLIKNIKLNSSLKKRIFPINSLISKDANPSMVHSSWALNDKESKHKIHLGSLKKINKKKIISLDNLIKKINKKIHFIKIDVDGFEFQVLKSGLKYIKKHKPIIHIEFAPYLHKEFGYSSKKLIYFIKNKLNYDFYNENLDKILNIENYTSNIKNRSENFFLFYSK